MPGFGGGKGSPELNCPNELVPMVVKQMQLMRERLGDGVGIRLDLNYNFKTEGFLQVGTRVGGRAVTFGVLGVLFFFCAFGDCALSSYRLVW